MARRTEEVRIAVERWMFLAFLALNVGDVLSTWYGLSLGLVELNPVGYLGFATIGFWPFCILKLIGLGVLWHIVLKRLSGPRRAHYTITVVSIMALVVVWNSINLIYQLGATS